MVHDRGSVGDSRDQRFPKKEKKYHLRAYSFSRFQLRQTGGRRVADHPDIKNTYVSFWVRAFSMEQLSWNRATCDI
jgi:hypothetical protein